MMTTEQLLERVKVLEDKMFAVEQALAPENPFFKAPTRAEIMAYARSKKFDDFPLDRFWNYWVDERHWYERKTGLPVKSWKRRANAFQALQEKYR